MDRRKGGKMSLETFVQLFNSLVLAGIIILSRYIPKKEVTITLGIVLIVLGLLFGGVNG